ncbi:hypothetical protein OROGR_018118 [Orobanche gracilis]
MKLAVKMELENSFLSLLNHPKFSPESKDVIGIFLFSLSRIVRDPHLIGNLKNQLHQSPHSHSRRCTKKPYFPHRAGFAANLRRLRVLLKFLSLVLYLNHGDDIKVEKLLGNSTGFGFLRISDRLGFGQSDGDDLHELGIL